MKCVSRVATTYLKATTFISNPPHQFSSSSSLSTPFQHARLNLPGLELALDKLRVRSYSSRKGSRKKNLEADVTEKDKDVFFVVRKGDVVGVYKTFTDCQAQVGSSICDPPVSIFKGHSLSKDSEAYILANGLQNALYSIRAADVKEDLFGKLVPLQFQQPTLSQEETSSVDADFLVQKILQKSAELDGRTSDQTCILEFDGASRGNPGKAGAGAILRNNDGSLICRIREGLGVETCNAAEYRAIILGLKYALEKGYKKIRVQGDSKLVCMQVKGSWKVKHPDISILHEQVAELKNNFLSFEIKHVLRKLNSDADAQANLAADLADGEVLEVFE